MQNFRKSCFDTKRRLGKSPACVSYGGHRVRIIAIIAIIAIRGRRRVRQQRRRVSTSSGILREIGGVRRSNDQWFLRPSPGELCGRHLYLNSLYVAVVGIYFEVQRL